MESARRGQVAQDRDVSVIHVFEKHVWILEAYAVLQLEQNRREFICVVKQLHKQRPREPLEQVVHRVALAHLAGDDLVEAETRLRLDRIHTWVHVPRQRRRRRIDGRGH